jgi:neutral ceramidase
MFGKAERFDFTPKIKMDMFAGTKAEKVDLSHSDREGLEVNVLALWETQYSLPLLFVAVDALYPGDEIRKAVETAAIGVPKQNIIVGASHTHQAPVTDQSKEKLGKLNNLLLDELCLGISRAVSKVLNFDEASSVVISEGTSIANHSVNRRRTIRFPGLARLLNIDKIQMAPNFNGTVDETVSVLSITNLQGTELARIWNYACHPVSHPNPERFSSHFVGLIRSQIRQMSEFPDLPILFFQGFSGNTRPTSSVGFEWKFKKLLFRIFDGATFRKIPSSKYMKWVQTLGDVVTGVQLSKFDPSRNISAKRISIAGENFAFGKPFHVSFGRISLGKRVVFYSISAEVVSEYAEFVRKLDVSKTVFCVGCADDTFGYIPTSAMLQEGGYEAGGYCNSFGLTALNPKVEENTLNGFLLLGDGAKSDFK